MYFNRRLMRRQRKLVLCSALLLIFIMVYIIIFVEDHNIKEDHFHPFSERCISNTAQNMITELCLNYTMGIAYGSLCPSICIERSVKINSCIHHGTTYVLVGEHNGENIVLKKKKPHRLEMSVQIFEESIKRTSTMEEVHQAYIDRFSDDVRSIFGQDSQKLFLKNFKKISRLLFGLQVERLTLDQLRNSWYLIGQDELVVMAIHQDMDSFPKLLGTCGPVYGMERIQPYSDFFPQLTPSMPWKKRVRIAKNFLHLIMEFERSGVGRLHHCDVQEANFGLTRDLNVKAIDVDLIYSPDRIEEILVQPDCNSDSDCDFFKCNGQCDVEKGKCTAKQLTNNLMTICREIFLPRWPNNGLLTHFQPTHIKKQLTTLLEDCSSRTFGTLSMDHHTVKRVLYDLEKLLDLSLETLR
ncbi:divergent protein kinase domain 1C-like [Clytia hemisphaerica]|uniref:Uncharacterized protein n=1 Tax=Clytia hemisphaerica TaxID=252671 RepID=A0A7M5V456_9CNID